MKRLARLGALAVLLSMLGFWAASAQSSIDLVAVDKVGWWTRRPAAQPADTGNFEVAAGVQGDESIAALRVLIHGEVTKATLVLAELDAPLSSVTPGKLQVCTTNVPWLVVDAGKWDDAPKADCGRSIELKREVDAGGTGSWRADVTSLLAAPSLSETSLMILPLADGSAVLPPTYYIKMSAHIEAEGTPDITTPAVKPVAVASPSSPSSPSRPAVSPSRPATPGITPSPAATAAPGPTPTPTSTVGTTPTSQPRRFAVASSHTPSKPWGKLVLLIPLAAIFGAAYAGAQRYVAERRLTIS